VPNSTDDDLDKGRTTSEVGDEGGGLGNVEVETDRGPGVGHEADETWRPGTRRRDVIVRDETGTGRRNP
jgi:hypothetical protein